MTLHRFVLRYDGSEQHFLSVRETGKGDLIVSPRGKQHSLALERLSSHGLQAPEAEASIRNITIHPNLNSTQGSITVNYKTRIGIKENRVVAGILGVRLGGRLFPVLASVGRNLSSRHLRLKPSSRGQIHHLWEGSNLDSSDASLAYCLVVANRDVAFEFPEEFPCQHIRLYHSRFQSILVYWSYFQATRARGLTVHFSTPGKYQEGMEFHETLNFITEVTLLHNSLYESFPVKLNV